MDNLKESLANSHYRKDLIAVIAKVWQNKPKLLTQLNHLKVVQRPFVVGNPIRFTLPEIAPTFPELKNALFFSFQAELTPELASATLDYFVSCGDRLSQMTKTYHDIDAVTRLLQEKEKDLELAAKIGQVRHRSNPIWHVIGSGVFCMMGGLKKAWGICKIIFDSFWYFHKSYYCNVQAFLGLAELNLRQVRLVPSNSIRSTQTLLPI